MPLMPAADIDVTEQLGRRLLTQQFPDLAGLPLRLAANGWDNAIFRLGSNLAVRLPRREAAAHLIEHEQRWLPQLTRGLAVPSPTPVRCGTPSAVFPWPWSVTPWFQGTTAPRSAFPPGGRGRRNLPGSWTASSSRLLPTPPPTPSAACPCTGVTNRSGGGGQPRHAGRDAGSGDRLRRSNSRGSRHGSCRSLAGVRRPRRLIPPVAAWFQATTMGLLERRRAPCATTSVKNRRCSSAMRAALK